ncbi:MAG: hypothetical protein ACK55I_48095, partial [bacterium]
MRLPDRRVHPADVVEVLVADRRDPVHALELLVLVAPGQDRIDKLRPVVAERGAHGVDDPRLDMRTRKNEVHRQIAT